MSDSLFIWRSASKLVMQWVGSPAAGVTSSRCKDTADGLPAVITSAQLIS